MSSRRIWVWVAGAVLTALVLGAALVLVQHQEGYFSPVISPDGQFAYFVKRSTIGVVWGLGWEFFTPPAKAFLLRDRFQLCRTKMDGSGFEILETWPRSPLEGTTVEEYRGRVFSIVTAALAFDHSRLHFEVALDVPRQPVSHTMVLKGEWAPQTGASNPVRAWNIGYVAGSGEDMLREPWEVLSVPGRESYPCAVVAYQDSTSELRVLKQTGLCARLYAGGIRYEHVAQQSRRVDIRRLRNLRDLREQLISQARAQGRNEGSAILEADRTLEQQGYYPTPPQLVARALSSEQAKGARPLFTISDMEYKVGLFDDIAKAIAAPGEEVEKSMGSYIAHRDYDTSRRLNQFLESGGKRFYVPRAGRVYEITLKEARPLFR